MQENILYYKNFLDLSQTIARTLFENIYYPWEALPNIKGFIVNLGKNLSTSAFDEIKENVWIAKTASISPTACITGPAIIDENSDIRHCAFIRGSVLIGKNCVVGNSTEIKNSVLFNNVQIPHFNYVGDSILGYRTHMGAGAIISNVKSDKTSVSVNLNGKRINTQLRKFGAIIGNYSEIGCNCVINPGTLIGQNSTIYPTSMVRGVIGENIIFKGPENIVKKV